MIESSRCFTPDLVIGGLNFIPSWTRLSSGYSRLRRAASLRLSGSSLVHFGRNKLFYHRNVFFCGFKAFFYICAVAVDLTVGVVSDLAHNFGIHEIKSKRIQPDAAQKIFDFSLSLIYAINLPFRFVRRKIMPCFSSSETSASHNSSVSAENSR